MTGHSSVPTHLYIASILSRETICEELNLISARERMRIINSDHECSTATIQVGSVRVQQTADLALTHGLHRVNCSQLNARAKETGAWKRERGN